MPTDRRIPDSAASYPEDRNLLAAVLEEPADVVVWPAVGLAELGFTDGQRALVATWRLDCEVRNGGFGQYFAVLGSEARAAAGEALAGLARLGASEHGRLLGEALALFEQGVAEDPDAARRRLSGEPSTVGDALGCGLRPVLGVNGPDLEAMRERDAERSRWRSEMRDIFGAVDQRYVALGRNGHALERYWVEFVRARPAEFFTR
jgi:hypothetical protein